MLITFEGPEGAGKTTAIAAAADQLRKLGHDIVQTREPGTGAFGTQIRQMLLEKEALDIRAEFFLFLADRANHVATLLRPALERGATVLCDRYTDSTLVYQGYARGLDIDEVRRCNDFATDGLSPDLTILFDLDPQIGLARLTSPDRLDREPLEFHQRVRVGFLREAHREPRRWEVIDASLPSDEVLEEVLRIIKERMESAGDS